VKIQALTQAIAFLLKTGSLKSGFVKKWFTQEVY